MSLHEYNTRTKKNEFQDALASVEVNLNNSIKSIKSDLKDEVNNLKDVIIKRLQDENLILRNRCSNVEQTLIEFETSTNKSEQYGRRNNIIISGIPDSVKTEDLEESVTKVLSDIDIKVTTSDIEACHRVGRSDNKIGSTKNIVRFVNRKNAKQALYNKKNFPKSRKNMNLIKITIHFL